jgi:hypothetical protein
VCWSHWVGSDVFVVYCDILEWLVCLAFGIRLGDCMQVGFCVLIVGVAQGNGGIGCYIAFYLGIPVGCR